VSEADRGGTDDRHDLSDVDDPPELSDPADATGRVSADEADRPPAPDPLGPLGEALRSAEDALPHPVSELREHGPHTTPPPHEQSLVARFDQAVDEAFDVLRGRPVADRMFYAATELGDFGLIWMLIGASQALRSDRELARAGRLGVTLAAESVLVNGVIKSFFKRERPVSQEPRPYKMRMPLTTSFPSGHSSTAVVAAMLLSQGSSAWPLYWGVAALVASSRVYVRIHHASDVVGGLATGLVIGSAARVIWRRLGA
jgi:undecaprenyl-diphosphatase